MLLKNAKVHVGDGAVIDDCDVLIRGGLIESVGQGIDGKGEEVRDLSGMELFPGFIDASSFMGTVDMAFQQHDNNEISSPVTPYLNIFHSLDPDELSRQELYRGGITSVALTPGNQCVVGGSCCVVKSAGTNVNRMAVKQNTALKASVTKTVTELFGKRKVAPGTRMAALDMLRQTLSDKPTDDDYRSKVTRDIVEAVLSRNIPLVIAAETKAEIESVAHVLAGLNIRLAFVLAYEAAQATDAILESGAAVILGECCRNAASQKHKIDYEGIVALADKGVNICLSLLTGDGEWGRECMLWTAAKLLKAGATPENVLSMMTVNPAKLFGVDDKIGSIAVGKEADIVVYDANPLTDCGAKLVETFIRGESVYKGV